jgi:hypothetical protein
MIGAPEPGPQTVGQLAQTNADLCRLQRSNATRLGLVLWAEKHLLLVCGLTAFVPRMVSRPPLLAEHHEASRPRGVKYRETYKRSCC